MTDTNPYVNDSAQFVSPIGGIITIELTERCNNNCTHCCINLPADCQSARARELPTDEILGIITQAAALGYAAVKFTGGEPLLRDDFTDIYLFTRRMGMQVIIFTNGTLITPQIADMFLDVPPLRNIEITLYGMSRNSYETVSRAPGSFSAAWRGIQLLTERQVPMSVKGALLPANIAEMDEFKQWASTIPTMDRPPIYSMNFVLRCRRDDAAKNNAIVNARMSPEDTVKAHCRSNDHYVAQMAQFAKGFLQVSGEQLFTCGFSLCVDPYGMLYPCTTIRHPESGYDLLRGSLKDAIDNFHPILKQLKAKNRDYLKRCARCFLRSLCDQCPARSWAEHGALDVPVDYFCDVAHAKARFLGLVYDSERAWEVIDWKERIADLQLRQDQNDMIKQGS